MIFGAVVLGILFLMACLVWSYNLFRLKNIQYKGLTRYSEEEFTQKLQDSFLMTWTPYFCISDTVSQKQIPFVELYEISYVDRNTVTIQVHEKRIVGCIFLMGSYMYFDKDGFLVESAPWHIAGVPLVEGLEFQDIVLYQKLNVQKQSLFDVILNLTRLIEQNELPIRKISFAADYQVTLFTEELEIQLGKRTSYDEQLNVIKNILPVAKGKSGILDMRNYSKENPDIILK